MLLRAHARAEFLKSAAVGIVATGVDIAVLTLLIDAVALSPSAANVPALLGGAVTQFAGCRLIVFRDARGPLMRLVLGFVAAEATALALNAVVFQIFVWIAPTQYALGRLVATFLVFAFFSFPAWRRIFRSRRSTGECRRSELASDFPQGGKALL